MDVVFIIAFVIITNINSFHEYFSFINSISKGIFSEMFYFNIFNWASFHSGQIVGFINFIPINHHF